MFEVCRSYGTGRIRDMSIEMITQDEKKGLRNVGGLRYGMCFRYAKALYMRVDSHELLFQLNHRWSFNARTGTGSVNTRSDVLVMRLANGKLSYFQRTTQVEPVTLQCVIKEDGE